MGTGDARTAFKTLTDHQRADVHRTVLDAPDLALMSADLLLEGRHWPRWAALNGAQAANRSGAFPRPSTLDAWWWRIVHSLPAPIIPPVRTPAPTEPFSLVFRITGRTLLREGVGALSVHIPNPTFSLSNKAWVEKAVETAQRVFSSPNVLPPWASMAQTLATVQGTQRIAALPIYTGKAVLDHDGVSAHQRLALLSSLSDSALMAA